MKKGKRVEQVGRGMSGSREEVGLFGRILLSCSLFAVVCFKQCCMSSLGHRPGREEGSVSNVPGLC